MEERLDIVVDPTSAKRGIDILVQSMSNLTGQTSKAESATTKLFQSLNGGLNALASKIINLRTVLASFTAVIASFRHLGEEITRFQAFISTMSVAVGTVDEAREEFSWLMQMSDRLGVSINSVSHNFAQMSAAAVNSGMAMSQVRDIFNSFSIAARVMHLSNIDTRLMFYALTQMISKGVVSMEELRRQLGEKLPGAMNLAAKAVGTTMPVLESLIRKGLVDSTKFLPIFAEIIKTSFSPGLPNAVKAFDAEVNRLNNTLKKIVVTFYDLGVADSFTGIVKELNRLLSDRRIAEAFAGAIRSLAGEVERFLASITAENIQTMVNNFTGALTTMAGKAGMVMETMKELAGYMALIIKGYIVLKGVTLGGAAGGAVSGGNPIGVGIGAVGGGVTAYTAIAHGEAVLARSTLEIRNTVYGKISGLRQKEMSDEEQFIAQAQRSHELLKKRYTLDDVLVDKKKGESQREIDQWNKRLASQGQKDAVKMAQDMQEAADSMVYTWNNVDTVIEDASGNLTIFRERVVLTKDEFKKMQEDIKANQTFLFEAQVENAKILTEQNEDMIYTWDALGNRVTLTKEAFTALQAEEKKVADFGHEIGMQFASAFENAIVEGQKFRQVLEGLLQDLLRVFLRINVTLPLVNAFANAASGGGLGSLFGGGGAASTGPEYSMEMANAGILQYASGTNFVPKDGLAYLHKGESVIPAGQNGMNVQVNLVNQSGEPLEARTNQSKVDAGGAVVELVLRRLSTDGASRQQLSGLLTGARNY